MPEIPRYTRTSRIPAVPRAARLPLNTGIAEAGRTLAHSLVELGKLAESLDEAKAVSFTSLGMAT